MSNIGLYSTNAQKQATIYNRYYHTPKKKSKKKFEEKKIMIEI